MNTVRLTALAVFVAVAAHSAVGQENSLAESNAEAQPFVIGDWYEVEIQRFGATKQAQGQLVKTDDDWIVLAVLRCQGTTERVPYVGDLPWVGQVFRRDRNVYMKVYDWVPRNALKVVKRSEITHQPSKELFEGESPVLEKGDSIGWVQGVQKQNDVSFQQGEFSALDQAKLCVGVETWEARRVEIPKSKRWPVIGASHTEEVVKQTAEKQIALDEIWFIEKPVFLPENPLKQDDLKK